MGAARRPKRLWKRVPLFEWVIVERVAVEGYVKLSKTMEVDEECYDPFAGVRDPKKPLAAVPKRRKSDKAISWIDLGASEGDGSS